jgi:hypothetical protein
MSGKCSTHGEMINAYRILAGMLEGKRPLGRAKLSIYGRIVLTWI